MVKSEYLYTPEQEILRPSIAFGEYLPEQTITNADLVEWGVTTASGAELTEEKILQRTGISRRFVAGVHEDQIDMGIAAARQAMEASGNFSPYAVMVASSYPVPGRHIAASVGHGAGAKSELALTGHFACSGAPELLLFMKDLEDEFNDKDILLVGAEKYSDTLADLRRQEIEEAGRKYGIKIDPSLAQSIFSDGAYAEMFRFGRDLKVLGGVRQEFDEETSRCLRMPSYEEYMVEPYISKSIPKPEYSDPDGKQYFEQDGGEVYKQVAKNVPDLIKQAVENAGLEAGDVKIVIPHQGSGHIVDTLDKRLPEYEVYKNMSDGNFSSASTLKGLKELVESGRVRKGDVVVKAGFGAGLYVAIAVVQLGELAQEHRV